MSTSVMQCFFHDTTEVTRSYRENIEGTQDPTPFSDYCFFIRKRAKDRTGGLET